MAGSGHRAAGPVEVWAARAWNVFNEGRPFSVVYPVAGAAGRRARSASRPTARSGSRCSARWPRRCAGAASRSRCAAARCCGWRSRCRVPLLEPWRAPRAAAGRARRLASFFTVVVWGTLYYHLRTGAPWTNGLRFWRLVLTNSDPTSGNALEQVPKIADDASAPATLLAEEPSAGSVAAGSRAAAAAGRAARRVAWRRFARTRLPRYPARTPSSRIGPALAAPRVRDRRRRLQPRAALAGQHAGDRPARARGHASTSRVEPAYPARTVVCFSSMLTGAAPRRARHALELRAAAGRAAASRSSTCSSATAAAAGSSGSRTCSTRSARTWCARSPRCSPPSEIDHSLVAPRRAAWSRRRTPTCWCSSCWPPTSSATCAACATPSTSTSSRDTDRHVGDFLAFLDERGKLDDATVILMADHGQGRGIGGHGHLDWGETPGAVRRLGRGRGARRGRAASRARCCELAATIAELLGVERARRPRAGARWCRPATPRSSRPPRPAGRCLAIVPARDEEPRHRPVCSRASRGEACGMTVDVLVVDDGSRDATAAHRPRARRAR